MTVYIDIYFLLGTVMNMIVLYLASRLVHINISFLRLAAGSSIGGVLSSLSLVFFNRESVKIVMSVIILFIMSAVVFGGGRFGVVLKNSFFTIMVSAQVSGLLELLAYFLGYGGEPHSAFLIMSLTIPAFFITILIYIRYMRKKLELISCDTVIGLKNRGGILELKGLYDSGNLLKDPYSGSPVILMTSTAFNRFSGDVTDMYTEFSDVARSFEKKGLLPILIPVSRCGGKTELIMGFKPEYVLLKRGGIIKNDVFTRNITVGVLTDISDFSGFECLLPAEII